MRLKYLTSYIHPTVWAGDVLTMSWNLHPQDRRKPENDRCFTKWRRWTWVHHQYLGGQKKSGANDRYTSMHLYVCICAGRDQRAMLDKSLTPRGTHADVQRLIGQPSTCSVAAVKNGFVRHVPPGKPKKTRSPARRFPISRVNLFTFHLCKLLKFYQILGFLLGEPVIFHTNGWMNINIGVL